VLLVLALPLAGFLLTGLFGRRMGGRPWIIAIAAVLVATAVATLLAVEAFTSEEPIRYGFSLYTWIPAGKLQVEFGFLFDNLTAVMLIVVTWIGALVHVYSIGYMAHDGSRWRFFAYLNLFMFSMLLLVLADSYLVTLAGADGSAAALAEVPAGTHLKVLADLCGHGRAEAVLLGGLFGGLYGAGWADLPLDHASRLDRGLARRVGDLQNVRRRGKRRKRIAQFVAQHGEELVLGAVGGLQRLLDEAIGQLQVVFGTRDIDEVAHVIPGVAIPRPVPLAIEPQHALHLCHRHRARGPAPPPIEEPVIAHLLIAQSQAPHRPRADAQDVGHLQPALPPTQRPQDDFLHLHGPLHRGPGVGHRHLPGDDSNSAARWERSNHVLSGAVR